MEYIFSKVFLEAYRTCLEQGRMRSSYIESAYNNLPDLENALRNFVYSVIGFRFKIGDYNLGEARIYFDNIMKNLPVESEKSLITLIDEYKDNYLCLLSSYPYVKMLMDVIKRFYSKEYDGKLCAEEFLFSLSDNAEAVIEHNASENSIVIHKTIRKTTDPLPSVEMHDIAEVEAGIKEFIEAVKSSNTDYNIFSNEGHSVYSEEHKTKMLLEGVMLNATTFDLQNLGLYFKRYAQFIKDYHFGSLTGLYKMGDAFDDELYFKVRKSDFEYETPYFMSFMLKNHRVELPNIRIGIDSEENKAYIVAVQTSQRTGNNPEVDATIKQNLKRTKDYNYSNPTHMTSLIIAFGLLNGMGINQIDVVDHMPIRYYKTIKDRNMNDQEADAYLARVTRQNINGFLKLESLTKGIDMTCDATASNNMTVLLSDEIICHNEFFQNLYDMGYNLGKTFDFSNRGIKK